MSRQTSMPLPSGRRASSTATSGWAASTRGSACSTEPASPTISKPGTVPSSSAIPRRTTSWSSSRKMRTGVSASVMRTVPSRSVRCHRRRPVTGRGSRRAVRARARRFAVPLLRVAPATPTPSSETVTTISPPLATRSTEACVAWACLATLVSASRTTAQMSSARSGSATRSTAPEKETCGGKPRAGVRSLAISSTRSRTPPVVRVERSAQGEDARPDPPDGPVDVLDPLLDALPDPVVGPEQGRDALQAQADREQFLDDVVVQVAGDTVAVLEEHDLLLRRARVRQLQRHAGVAGEAGRHLQVAGRERRAAPVPGRC